VYVIRLIEIIIKHTRNRTDIFQIIFWAKNTDTFSHFMTHSLSGKESENTEYFKIIP